jgi:hypothetical protein
MTVIPARPARHGGAKQEEGGGAAGGGDDFARVFDDFDKGIREAIDDALNIAQWTAGERMGDLEERLEREVETAIAHEDKMAPRVLDMVRNHISEAPDASCESGIYSVKPEQITAACRSVLFNGLVEACDGTRVTYETLPISVIQIGLCMTSYLDDGAPTSIGHRLFRHDMVRANGNVTDQVMAFIQQRSRLSARHARLNDEEHRHEHQRQGCCGRTAACDNGRAEWRRLRGARGIPGFVRTDHV